MSLFPSPARAHGVLKLGEFFTGLSQPVFHPESLALVLAVLLWSSQRDEPLFYRVPFAFAAAAVAGSLAAAAAPALPGAPWLARGGTLVLALAVAARQALPGPAALAAGVALGLVAGYQAAGPERAALARPWLYGLGFATAVLVAWGYVASFALNVRAFWAQLAVRIVGSWIAAVTLLVSVLALARP